LVLVVSNFQPTRQFGALTASAMVTGLVGELILLPPLMLVMRTKLGIRSELPDLTGSERVPLHELHGS
jgi:hypothetical protein